MKKPLTEKARQYLRDGFLAEEIVKAIMKGENSVEYNGETVRFEPLNGGWADTATPPKAVSQKPKAAN